MLNKLLPDFDERTDKLAAIGTSGYITVLGFSMHGVQHSFTTYPEDWLEIYQEKDYYFGDPVFVWSLSNSGTRRWSDIDLPDLRGVMRHAQAFGLRYGAIASIKTGALRSIVSISRDDRELEDAELDFVSETLRSWVKLMFKTTSLSQRELDVLRCLKNGMGQSEIAAFLGISESTVKQRAQKSLSKLDAKTRTQAVVIALQQGHLDL